MPIATITSKGQVTLPKEIRDRLGLAAGDRVDFRIDENGKVVMEPRIPIDRLYGILATGGPTLTLDFRDLDMLNSSGIGTFGQFLVEVRKAKQTQVKIVGSAAKPWQARTLALLKKIWDQVELVIT